MGTNVYLSTNAFSDVDLGLAHVGPTTDYSGNYHLKQTKVSRSADEVFVLEIDRDGFHAGDAVELSELRLSVSGIFCAALQILLDNRNQPLKNTIHWGWRAQTALISAFVDDHDKHPVSYHTADISVEFSVQGAGTAGYDDIYISLTAVQRRFVSLSTALDSMNQRSLSFAVNDIGLGQTGEAKAAAPEIWTMNSLSNGPKFSGLSAPIASLSDGAQPFFCAITADANLWVWNPIPRTGSQLPFGLGNPQALTMSELAFDGHGKWCECFSVATPAGSQRLYRRKLRLDPEPRWETDWSDWGLCTDMSYAPGAYRYVLTIAPSTLGTPTIYYSYASIGSDSWSLWWSRSLPDAKPRFVTAVTWFDGKTPKNVGAVVVADNGRLFYSTDSLRSRGNEAPTDDLGEFNSWIVVAPQNISNVTSKAQTGFVPRPHQPVIVRSSNTNGLFAADFWIKEHQIGTFKPIDNTVKPRVASWYAFGSLGASYLIFENENSANLEVVEMPNIDQR